MLLIGTHNICFCGHMRKILILCRNSLLARAMMCRRIYVRECIKQIFFLFLAPRKHSMLWLLIRSTSLNTSFMSNHNICFHGEIRKKINTFWLKTAPYLEPFFFRYYVHIGSSSFWESPWNCCFQKASEGLCPGFNSQTKPDLFPSCCLTLVGHYIMKTCPFKYIENFSSKKFKIFR